MRINEEQYGKIKHALPVQRGNITLVDVELIKRLLDSMIVPVHPDACGALKKR